MKTNYLNGFFCPDGGPLSQPLPMWKKAPQGEWKGWFYKILLVFSNLELRSEKENSRLQVCAWKTDFVLFCFCLSAKGTERK